MVWHPPLPAPPSEAPGPSRQATPHPRGRGISPLHSHLQQSAVQCRGWRAAGHAVRRQIKPAIQIARGNFHLPIQIARGNKQIWIARDCAAARSEHLDASMRSQRRNASRVATGNAQHGVRSMSRLPPLTTAACRSTACTAQLASSKARGTAASCSGMGGSLTPRRPGVYELRARDHGTPAVALSRSPWITS